MAFYSMEAWRQELVYLELPELYLLALQQIAAQKEELGLLSSHTIFQLGLLKV